MSNIIIIHAEEPSVAAEGLSGKIKQYLDNKQSVLWLVSGGSALDVACRARVLIGSFSKDKELHVALIDERYGPVNHQDSNFKGLIDRGFDTKNVTMHPVLNGLSMGKTADAYSRVLSDLLAETDVAIGLFGMGADGHTAGLLPDNPIMESDNLVGSYNGPDFGRISITPKFVSSIDTAVLYAIGNDKWPEIQKLLNDERLTGSPAGILKDIDKLIVYTDYQGGRT